MIFDDIFAPQDDEEERRRQLLDMTTGGDGAARRSLFLEEPSPPLPGSVTPPTSDVAEITRVVNAYKDKMAGVTLPGDNFWERIGRGIGDPIQPVASDIYQSPMNSMKPAAIVPIPEERMWGSAADQVQVPHGRRPWANFMGPLTPDQQASDTKLFANGVTINDGFDGGGNLLRPQAAGGPGAGYTFNGASGIAPIAAPGDMDWGNRVAQDPYTNPLVQNMIRRHQMDMELQKQAQDSHFNLASMISGIRDGHNREQERLRGMAIAGNPKIPPEIRKSTIKELGIPDADKESMLMEADLTTTDKKGNPVNVGVDGEGSFAEIMNRASHYDTAKLRRFLASQRGVGLDVAADRLNKLNNNRTPANMKEMNFIQKMYGDDLKHREGTFYEQIIQGDMRGRYEPK